MVGSVIYTGIMAYDKGNKQTIFYKYKKDKYIWIKRCETENIATFSLAF